MSKNVKIQDVANEIIKFCTENEIVPWKFPYNYSTPKNCITNHKYTGINKTWLSVHTIKNHYNTPLYSTYNGFKKNGGQIRKGEKGTKIVVAKTNKFDSTDDNGNPVTKFRTFFGDITVFNIDQCDDLSPEDFGWSYNKDTTSHNDCEKFFDTITQKPKIIHNNPRTPCYIPKKDEINMPDFSNFISNAHYWGSLLHETIHWTGHPSRLNRDGIKNIGDDHTYSFEELIAELGAATLSQALMGTNAPNFNNSASYIQNWLTHLQNNPEWIVKATKHAEQAIKYLTNDAPNIETFLSNNKEDSL